MTTKEIIKYLEVWAPLGAQWDKDNSGLQAGSLAREVNNIFLCLELNQQALDQAIKYKCNFIFTHHPLIFSPLKNLNFQNDKKAQLIEKIVKNDITVYSAHTSLDFTRGGVSFKLADRLNLQQIDFLQPQIANQYKITVFTPEKYSENVTEALFNAGAGRIGNYSDCSFGALGTGTFTGNENSNPVLGKKGNFEKVREIKTEVLVDKWNLNKVIKAIQSSHPYEEPAYDIYPVENTNKNYGSGAIGILNKPMPVNEFLTFVKNKLKLNNFRYCAGNKRLIKTVAVCGGSCAEYFNHAVNAGADAFITADVKYHTFEDAEKKILLIDAGHYETEVIVLDEVKKYFEKFISLQSEKIKVIKFKGSSNPVKFFN